MAASSTAGCAFCHDISPKTDKGIKVTLKLKSASGKIMAHSKCLQYSSNLFQKTDNSWDPKLVDKELTRIKRLNCSACKLLKKEWKTGAGSGCAYGRCKHGFHFPCVPIIVKCRNEDAEDMYLSFCSEACETKFFGNKSSSRLVRCRREEREVTLKLFSPTKSKVTLPTTTTTTTTTTTPIKKGKENERAEARAQGEMPTGRSARKRKITEEEEEEEEGENATPGGVVRAKAAKSESLLGVSNVINESVDGEGIGNGSVVDDSVCVGSLTNEELEGSAINKSVNDVSAIDESAIDGSATNESINDESAINASVDDESVNDGSAIDDRSAINESAINESVDRSTINESAMNEFINDESAIDVSVNDVSAINESVNGGSAVNDGSAIDESANDVSVAKESVNDGIVVAESSDEPTNEESATGKAETNAQETSNDAELNHAVDETHPRKAVDREETGAAAAGLDTDDAEAREDDGGAPLADSKEPSGDGSTAKGSLEGADEAGVVTKTVANGDEVGFVDAMDGDSRSSDDSDATKYYEPELYGEEENGRKRSTGGEEIVTSFEDAPASPVASDRGAPGSPIVATDRQAPPLPDLKVDTPKPAVAESEPVAPTSPVVTVEAEGSDREESASQAAPRPVPRAEEPSADVFVAVDARGPTLQPPVKGPSPEKSPTIDPARREKKSVLEGSPAVQPREATEQMEKESIIPEESPTIEIRQPVKECVPKEEEETVPGEPPATQQRQPTEDHPDDSRPPLDEPFDSDDGSETRAVCVKIRERNLKVQCKAGFVFPPAIMDGRVKADDTFFEPRREAIDLYKVVNELTHRKYRLIEFSPVGPPSPGQSAAGAPSGNQVLDLLLPHLRSGKYADEGEYEQEESAVVVNLHVVHPRPQREFFRFLLEDSFTKLCDDLVAKVAASPNPDGESAMILFPLFVGGIAVVQPIYNGVIVPTALSRGLTLNCMIGSRKDECGEARMIACDKWKWPSCALIQIVPKNTS